MGASGVVLSVRDLRVEFGQGRRTAPLVALDGVSLDIPSGETVGLVGESGSGKSTLGRAVLGLTPIAAGSIVFDGEDISRATRRRRRELSKDLQVVFQDPYSSLNPAKTIADVLAEPIRVHQHLSRKKTEARVSEMLTRVGLPSSAARRYAGEFSGGERQRIAIARALTLSPRLVICDEPTSSLDLSIQAQVLNLLLDLQRTLGVSYLFISHNLGVVRYACSRVVVLYGGQIMESGPAELVCCSPAHPYTRSLFAAAPSLDPLALKAQRMARARETVLGEVAVPQQGCPFFLRCRVAIPTCGSEQPPPQTVRESWTVRCHLWQETSDGPPHDAECRLKR